MVVCVHAMSARPGIPHEILINRIALLTRTSRRPCQSGPVWKEDAAISSAELMRATDIWTSHVDSKTLVEIGQERRGPCVSMFRPIAGASGENSRAMAALIEKAHNFLRQAGIGREVATAVLHPAEGLVEADRVWTSGSHGIGVFASPDMFAVVLTGIPLATQVVVSKRFVTRPLLPALEDLTEFELRWALAELAAHPGDDRVVTDLGKLLAAAPAGRVVELYVDREARAWGCFDTATSLVERVQAMAPIADDLIDLAAVKTIASGGRVHVAECLEYGGESVPVLARVRSKSPATLPRGRRGRPDAT